MKQSIHLSGRFTGKPWFGSLAPVFTVPVQPYTSRTNLPVRQGCTEMFFNICRQHILEVLIFFIRQNADDKNLEKQRI